MIGLATGALLAAVWQGVLLAAVVWLGLRLLPKTPAAVRFAIWFGVFLVVTALPLVSLSRQENAVQAGGRGAWLTLDMRWSLAIAAVWAAASLVRAVTLMVAAVRVRALWMRATPVDFELSGKETATEILSFAQNDDTVLSARRAQLCVSDEVDRPTVIGFFSPKILIPAWLLEKLTPAELEQIVMHEVGHLGRADDWMNLLQKVALVIFPLNPVLAWVERRLCFERELAVDERVLQAFAGKAGAATAYASCLATVAEHRLGRRGIALALGALGRESELAKRVGRILRRGEMMRPAHARLLLGGALMALLGASAGLERCPELVGFAPHEPVVAQADLVNIDSSSLIHKEQFSNVLQAESNVPHERLLRANAGGNEVQWNRKEGASQGLKPGIQSDTLSGLKPGPFSEAKAVAGTRAASTGEMFSEERPGFPRSAQQPAAAMQLVVVSEWQDEYGVSRTTRMVLTTAPVENPAARAQRTQTGMTPATQQDSEQVHPYAAVPVRGGWLVIQL